MVSGRVEQRVRQVGIHQHAEQPEGHDVGDRIGHFALVGVDRRRRRDDRGDAADARARRDQRAQPRRQAQLPVEPRHEHQAGRNRGQDHGQSRDPELDDVEDAEPNADEHDAECEESCVVAELQARRRAPRAAAGCCASSRPSTIATGTPDTGLLPRESLRGENLPPDDPRARSPRASRRTPRRLRGSAVSRVARCDRRARRRR